jgi:DNA-binding response OmpR family regulator
MAQTTILVVDDEPAITASLSYCLEQEGYKVISAQDGKEAVQKVMEHTPDLIISDVMMPEVDGHELCRRIRKYYRTRHIPFLFLSAKSTSESKLQGLELGCDDYITKPFELTELITKVRRIIKQKKAAPESELPAKVQRIIEQKAAARDDRR